MDVRAGGIEITNIDGINVILGKNGCGKSHLLKQLEVTLRKREGIGKTRYLSPERGGLLNYEPGIDQSITNSPDWLETTRRRNQADNFRQQSAALFRRLELLTLREIERDHTKPGYVARTFDSVLDEINILLDRV